MQNLRVQFPCLTECETQLKTKIQNFEVLGSRATIAHVQEISGLLLQIKRKIDGFEIDLENLGLEPQKKRIWQNRIKVVKDSSIELEKRFRTSHSNWEWEESNKTKQESLLHRDTKNSYTSEQDFFRERNALKDTSSLVQGILLQGTTVVESMAQSNDILRRATRTANKIATKLSFSSSLLSTAGRRVAVDKAIVIGLSVLCLIVFFVGAALFGRH
eukprot:GHVP01052843.1.p1 GENE.GHVP01052843.1~~GHVP01052843.1.p1  ORF type:complete len:224 (+),score=36.15 GHVP01052843.1:27-674(+)